MSATLLAAIVLRRAFRLCFRCVFAGCEYKEVYTGVGLDTASVHPNPNATPLHHSPLRFEGKQFVTLCLCEQHQCLCWVESEGCGLGFFCF